MSLPSRQLVTPVAALLLFSLPLCATAQPPLVLVKGGQSAFVIYHDPGAPPSVQQAASEVQRVIRISTGVKLPVQDTPAWPMICLGDNAAARQEGLASAGLSDDGFLIASKQGSLYILGKDYPHDQPPWSGWSSRGTLYGAYEFLERVVGVRWLMPGQWGEDIPAHTQLTVAPLSLRETPAFSFRYLADIQDRRPPGAKGPNEVTLWLAHNKLASTNDGRKLQYGHSWGTYIKPEVLAQHPEFLAADDHGKRRTFKNRRAIKYCTTNPGLVQAFAAGVNRWLDDHPTQRCASISPSDGGDFCQCPRCQALVTKDPHGNPSYTNLILRFYNQVAKLVAQKHPHRLVAGYVYYNYMYPPARPVQMASNLYLVLAPLNYYGYGLFKPVYRREFAQVIAGWLAVTPHFIYDNYSNWMRSFNGAPLPPGLDILKLELPTVYRLGGRGAEMVGQGAWGYGGPTNYILARLLWNANANVDQLFTDWLQRAYGPGWRQMQQVYLLIDQRLKERKERESPRYRGDMYEVNYDVIAKVYLPIFPEIERRYVAAMAQAATEAQRRRLQMFGDNLVMLHYDMCQAGMPVPDPRQSVFYRTKEQYQRFLADTVFSLALYRNSGKRYTGPIWRGQWSG